MSIFQDPDDLFAEHGADADPAAHDGDEGYDDQEDGEEECDLEHDCEINPDETVDSFPATEIDGDTEDHDHDEIEMTDLDPYRYQPDNQLGLDDYRSPRAMSEEHTPLPSPAHDEREVPVATPNLRKAVHLNPEELPSSSSSKSSPGANESVDLFLTTSLPQISMIYSRPPMKHDLCPTGAVDPAVARVNSEMDAIVAELKRLVRQTVICHVSYLFQSIHFCQST